MSSESKTVYFVQHGLAIDKNDDPERPLSADGISQTTAIAQFFGKIPFTTTNPPPSHIYHSDKLRSLQTAEIFATALLKSKSEINQHSHLSPNDDIQLLIAELKNNALYVGHLPHLNTLSNHLLQVTEPSNTIQFKNSSIICLTLAEAGNRLNWYLTPEVITVNGG